MRYVGEPVAVVFAADQYLAEDAADLVELEIEPLPVVLDAAGEPGRFDDTLSTETTVIEKSYGDVDPRHSPAQRMSSSSISQSAAIPACRWRRAAPSRHYDEKRDVLEMHGAAKVPHWNRDRIA